MMKDPKTPPNSLKVSFCFAVLLLLFISTIFRIFFSELVVSSSLLTSLEIISGDSPPSPVGEAVIFPDQVLVFLRYPQSTPLLTKHAINCLYLSSSPNSSHSMIKLSPVSMEDHNLGNQIIRCPVLRSHFLYHVLMNKSDGKLPTHQWDWLAYEALVDSDDNTTIVFAKGLRLPSGRPSNASRFQCVYTLDSTKSIFKSNAISAAQEIVRCKTPFSILTALSFPTTTIKVTVRVIGRHTLPSIARIHFPSKPDPPTHKQHKMCLCTMLRNQARFLPEWIIYHSRIGVQRWFIYDNNSNDDIHHVITSLLDSNFNITRHLWPWIKTQEAGFAHCAIRARDSCEWVGFIDVDEFFHLKSHLSLHDILSNYSARNDVAELRTLCYSFGPSGLKKIPTKGVTIGYTCRLRSPERHKSILRPGGMNSTLINMVHHFHLRNGFGHVNLEKSVMVINHYKYQVWDVFKEKFHGRVATYVTDWQKEKNVGSKDRAPGLGTKPVEPQDWSNRFCEVKDRGLRNRILQMFVDKKSGSLPWQEMDKNYETIQ